MMRYLFAHGVKMNNIFADNYFADSKKNDQHVFSYLEFAKDQLRQLFSGELFVLSDLFYGYEWNRIPKQDRILLGRNFYEFAKSEEGKKLIEISEKGQQHKQVYVRK